MEKHAHAATLDNEALRASYPASHAWTPTPEHISGPLYVLSAMIELTMSLSFSFRALTAFDRETLACCMTSSISLPSSPSSSTSSSSSSSSFLASLVSMALPLPWSCEASAASALASCWAAAACACELRSSILASPKMLVFMRLGSARKGYAVTHIQVLLLGDL